MINDELIAEARGKYKSLDGVVVVSPKLLALLADALQNTSTTVEEDALYIAHLEAMIRDLETSVARHKAERGCASCATEHAEATARYHSAAVEYSGSEPARFSKLSAERFAS